MLRPPEERALCIAVSLSRRKLSGAGINFHLHAATEDAPINCLRQATTTMSRQPLDAKGVLPQFLSPTEEQ
jgi:hypothetical protein